MRSISSSVLAPNTLTATGGRPAAGGGVTLTSRLEMPPHILLTWWWCVCVRGGVGSAGVVVGCGGRGVGGG